MVTPQECNWPIGNPSLWIPIPTAEFAQDLYYKIAQEYLARGNTVYYPSAEELPEFNRVCKFFRQYQWDPRKGIDSAGLVAWTFNAM